MCLECDTKSSPGASDGWEGDSVIPGLFFLGDFLGFVLDLALLTDVLRNSLNRFLKEVTMAPYRDCGREEEHEDNEVYGRGSRGGRTSSCDLPSVTTLYTL